MSPTTELGKNTRSSKLWPLRLAYYCLCAIFLLVAYNFSGNPATFYVLVCSFMVLMTWALIETFVFQRDIAGLNLFGLMLRITRMAPIVDGESIEFEEKFASGAFNKFFPWWGNIMHVLLTNERMIVRFVTSRRGICLMSVPIGDIQSVAIRWSFLRAKLLYIDLRCDHEIHRFILATYKGVSWIESFGRVGVSVEGSKI